VASGAQQTSQRKRELSERRAQQHAQQLRRIRRQRIIFGAAALVMVLALLVALDLIGNAGKIHRGVRVSAIDLSGKTKAQAQSYLDTELARMQKRAVTVTYGKQKWRIAPADLGLDYDTARIAEDAYQVGRGPGILQASKARIQSYFKPQSVMLRVTPDEEMMNAVYGKIMAKTDKAAVNAAVTLKEDASGFVVSEGSDGTALEKRTLTNMLIFADITGQKTVAAPVKRISRTIDRATALVAQQAATKGAAETITAHYGQKSWDLEPTLLRKLFVFKLSNNMNRADAQLKLPAEKSSSKVSLVPVVSDEAVARNVIPLMGTTVGTPPVPASFSVSGGVVSIIPSKNGLGADPQKLSTELVAQMQSAKTSKSITVVTHEVEPSFTTAKARALGIKERIATFTTTFPDDNEARLTNITLLAKALDGAVVMPGAEFSLNGTVGEADAAKGYQEAGVIVGDKVEKEVGGGICQVNTTLFNAALYAGVRITERVNHSLYINSYPLGRDAAVSWPEPDFKFVNTLDHAILIVTNSTRTTVTVSFYGVDPGYSIELSPGTWLSHTPAPVKKVDDPTLPVGTELVQKSGRAGGKVEFTQTVMKNGVVVLKRTFTSLYIPETKVVKVGKKPTTPSAPAAPKAN